MTDIICRAAYPQSAATSTVDNKNGLFSRHGHSANKQIAENSACAAELFR
jgi:hypothetical protein